MYFNTQMPSVVISKSLPLKLSSPINIEVSPQL